MPEICYNDSSAMLTHCITITKLGKIMKLTDNFYLSEFLKSSTAIKMGESVVAQQNSPSDDVIESLRYLADATLQPMRSYLCFRTDISSGYRCEVLNTKIGSSSRSQHPRGEAADIKSKHEVPDKDKVESDLAVAELKRTIKRIVGRDVRSNVNREYFMWAYFCINLDNLDIDQVIHEYGHDGHPSWVHVASSSDETNRGRITIKRNGDDYTDINLFEALALGCEDE